MKETLKGCKIGILLADGSDAPGLSELKAAIEKAEAQAFVVVPRVGSAKLSDGSTIKADGQLQGSPSQLFDAVAALLSKAGATIDLDVGVTELDEMFIAADAKRFWDREPKLCLLA